MNLTNPQRLSRLIGNLIKNPDLIYPYLARSILARKSPLDLGLPWWSYRAISRCDEIASGRKVFEYGTGGSTIRYGRIAQSITSVEDDIGWFNTVNIRLAEKGVKADVVLAPFDFSMPVDFEDSDYLHAIDGIDWNLLIIDGRDETFKERLACFRYAEPLANEGDVIIVDDFWRYEELLESVSAKAIEVYESVGPCRVGVTSTAFFFY